MFTADALYNLGLKAKNDISPTDHKTHLPFRQFVVAWDLFRSSGSFLRAASLTPSIILDSFLGGMVESKADALYVHSRAQS